VLPLIVSNVYYITILFLHAIIGFKLILVIKFPPLRKVSKKCLGPIPDGGMDTHNYLEVFPNWGMLPHNCTEVFPDWGMGPHNCTEVISNLGMGPHNCKEAFPS